MGAKCFTWTCIENHIIALLSNSVKTDTIDGNNHLGK